MFANNIFNGYGTAESDFKKQVEICKMDNNFLPDDFRFSSIVDNLFCLVNYTNIITFLGFNPVGEIPVSELIGVEKWEGRVWMNGEVPEFLSGPQ